MTSSIQSATIVAAQPPRFFILSLSILATFLIISCQLPRVECLANCATGWQPVGTTDCLLIGNTPLNISQARQFCLSHGNNSKLLILRNYQFNELLFGMLNSTQLRENDSSVAEPAILYWTGAHVTSRLGLEWLDSNYTDLSMSPLPGGAAVLPRYHGMQGALQLGAETLKLSFLNGSKSNAVPLCARQPVESPYQPAVPFNSLLKCNGVGATLHRGLCYRVLNSPSLVASRWNRSAALQACRNWSAEAGLAVMNDFNSQFLATALIGSKAHGHAWIGLEYHDAKYWAWQSGSNDSGSPLEIRHSNWKQSEPSSPFQREACVVAHQREASLGDWNNVPCTDTFSSALCQAPPSKGSGGNAPLPIGVNKDAAGHLCREGFFAYGDVCWMLDDRTSGTRADMTAQCTNRSATLALFHHRAEQAFLSALSDQLGVNLTSGPSIWLGLNVETVGDTKNDWLLTWDDGSSADYDFVFKILPSQIKNSDNVGHICTALNLQSNSLEARLCNDTEPLLACRYILVEHPLLPNKSQELICPTDSDTPEAVNGKCFKLFATRDLNWTDAEQDCQNRGGHLASVHSRQEQLAINALMKKLTNHDDAWIGLTVLTVEGQQHLIWSDETGAQFFQFRHGYPVLPLGMLTDQMCVSINRKYGEWMTELDSKRLPYICQFPGLPLTTTTSTVNTTTPTTLGNTTPSSSSSSSSSTAPPLQSTTSSADSRVCQSAINSTMSTPMLDGSGCIDYLFVDSKTEAKSWQDADIVCQQRLTNGGRLASISSLNESDSVLRFLRKLGADQLVWLGASTTSSPVANAYSTWLDNSPMQFVYFVPLDNKPNEAIQLAGSLCLAMETKSDSKYPGQFRSMDCNTSLPFLCKQLRPFNKSAASNPDQQQKLGTNFACPNGFVSAAAGDAACYRILDNAVPYNEANGACKSAYAGSRLASYQTQRQLQRMASLLASAASETRPLSAWIGLQFNPSASSGRGQFCWTDGSQLLTTDWAVYGDAEISDCVQLSSGSYWWLSGHMSTEPCSTKLRPLCRAEGVPRVASASAAASTVGCPANFVRFNSACYAFNQSVVSFADANSACVDRKASLLELEQGGAAQSAELHFLRSAFPPQSAVVWLGLGAKPWTWRSDGRPLRSDLLYPAAALHRLTLANVNTADCYALDLGWGLRASPSCSNKFAYICKRPADDTAAGTTPTPDGIDSDCRGKQWQLVNASSDGRACLRWDVVLANGQSSKDALIQFVGETVGSAATFCRNVSAPPSCFVSGSSSQAQPQLADCSVPACPTIATSPSSPGANSAAVYSPVSVAVAIVLALCSAAALIGLAVIGFRLWRRGRWAAGYRPQLNLDAATGMAQRGSGGGGTSFHNPIYMPANC